MDVDLVWPRVSMLEELWPGDRRNPHTGSGRSSPVPVGPVGPVPVGLVGPVPVGPLFYMSNCRVKNAALGRLGG